MPESKRIHATPQTEDRDFKKRRRAGENHNVRSILPTGLAAAAYYFLTHSIAPSR
jgi:hypothetical protein